MLRSIEGAVSPPLWMPQYAEPYFNVAVGPEAVGDVELTIRRAKDRLLAHGQRRSLEAPAVQQLQGRADAIRENQTAILELLVGLLGVEWAALVLAT